MKLLASDAHLGDESPADDFSREMEYHFLRFLEYAGKEAERLVILGDFLEMGQCAFSDIYQAHSAVIKKVLSMDNVKGVIGNHDKRLIGYRGEIHLGTRFRESFEEDGLWAEHGHRFDKYPEFIDDAAIYIGGVGERLIHRDFEHWVFKAFDDVVSFIPNTLTKIFGSSTPYRDREKYQRLGGDLSEYTAAAKKLLKKHDIVVFGHTHEPGIWKFENGIYANTGSWVEPDHPPTFVRVSDDNRNVELVDALTYKTIDSAYLKVPEPAV